MTNNRELRTISNSFECRSENEDMVVSGFAIRYNEPSQDLGGFIEFVEKGSVSESVATNDVAMLYNHKTDNILGRTSAKTLELNDTEQGLFFKIKLPFTTLGKDTYESLKRGDIQGCSFGFRVLDEDWDFTETIAKRFLKKVDLFEISFTPFPAYNSTSVNVREIQEQNDLLIKMKKDIEDYSVLRNKQIEELDCYLLRNKKGE